jgi:hypothetical protein
MPKAKRSKERKRGVLKTFILGPPFKKETVWRKTERLLLQRRISKNKG